jgi:hypothetical protein
MISEVGPLFSTSCFIEVLMLVCWSIWNHRNRAIFDNKPININECLRFFKEDFILVRHRAKPSLKEGMSSWLDTL